MAPTKRSTRSSLADSRPQKIIKRDPVDENLEVVARQLRQASNLPEHVRTMLIAMLPESLGVPKDQRHVYQDSLVQVLEKTSAEIKDQIQRRIDEMAAFVDSADVEKSNVEANHLAAQAAWNEKRELVAAQNAELTSATMAFKDAKPQLADAEAAQAEGDAALDLLGEKKREFEGAVDKLCTPLRESTWSQHQISELVLLGDSHNFDSSLLLALPSVLEKEVNHRSPFDGVVMKGLEEAMAKTVSTLDMPLQAGAPAKAARAEAVQVAQASFQAAKEKQSEVAGLVKAAQEAEKQSRSSFRAAEKAVKQFLPQIENARRTCERYRQELSIFSEAFSELLDHKTPSADAEDKTSSADAEEALHDDSVAHEALLASEPEEPEALA